MPGLGTHLANLTTVILTRWLLWPSSAVLLLVSCGRTDLDLPSGVRSVASGEPVDARDAAAGTPIDARDAATSDPIDVPDAATSDPIDAGDAATTGDAAAGDAAADAAARPPDCTETTSRQVYFLLLRGVLFSDLHGDLYRLDPETDSLGRLGTLDCGAPEGTYPYSMAVDRHGIVWVYYWFDRIYRVDPADMSCSSTDYVTALDGSLPLPFVFSMAFAGGADGPETLYAALNNPQFTGEPCAFGSIDALGASAEPRGQLCPSALEYMSLAGQEDGRLFALMGDRIFEVDSDSGSLSLAKTLPRSELAWPTSWTPWGDGAYLFGHYGLTNEPVQVVRYESSTGAMTLIAPIAANDGEILLAVGAGSGKCAGAIVDP